MKKLITFSFFLQNFKMRTNTENYETFDTDEED